MRSQHSKEPPYISVSHAGISSAAANTPRGKQTCGSEDQQSSNMFRLTVHTEISLATSYQRTNHREETEEPEKNKTPPVKHTTVLISTHVSTILGDNWGSILFWTELISQADVACRQHHV